MPPTESEVSQRHPEKSSYVGKTAIFTKILIRYRCDLSRPCQTCRDREHPELCSYHPPNKRQSIDQSSSVLNDGSAPGSITLGRGEFDFLCRKLNMLENSIADLRREMRLHGNDGIQFHNGDATVGANIDPAVHGRPRKPTHTDVHGVHIKNDAVRPPPSFLPKLALTRYRARLYTSAVAQYQPCSMLCR